MEQAVEHGMSLRDKDIVYEHVCVDEKSYQKHHRYGSILYDEDGTVIDVVEGRSKESVRKLFAGCLTPRQRMCVKTIAMDMLDTFINAQRCICPTLWFAMTTIILLHTYRMPSTKCASVR